MGLGVGNKLKLFLNNIKASLTKQKYTDLKVPEAKNSLQVQRGRNCRSNLKPSRGESEHHSGRRQGLHGRGN